MINKWVSAFVLIGLDCQAIEIQEVGRSSPSEREKKGGLNFGGMSTEVIDNTCRKNVRFQACAEVIEK